jgi:hypothetical protein
MIFYYTIYALIAVFVLSRYRNNTTLVKAFLLLFFMLSFIRWDTGTDWDSYRNIFMQSAYYMDWRETGFALLNWIVRKVTDNYTVMLLVEACILFLCIRKPIREFSTMPLLTVLSFYCLNKGDIFFTREILAVAICLMVTYLLYENKYIPSIILWIIACSIHTSAIVFVVAFFLRNRKLKFKEICMVIIIALFASSIIYAMLRIPSIANTSIMSRVALYAFNTENMAGYGSGASKMFYVVRASITKLIVFVAMIFARKKYKEDTLFNMLFNFITLEISLYLGLASTSIVLARISDYYGIFEIFCYPYIVNMFKSPRSRGVVLLVIVLYLGLRLYFGINSYYECFVPFKTIFSL